MAYCTHPGVDYSADFDYTAPKWYKYSMSEIPSGPSDYERNHFDDAEDVRNRHDWHDVAATAFRIGDVLRQAVFDEDDYDRALDMSSVDLDYLRQQIGEAYESGKAEVEGYAYRVEFDEYDNTGIGVQQIKGGLHKVGSASELQEGVYEGCELHWLEGRWQPLMMVEVGTPDTELDEGLYGFILSEPFLDNEGEFQDYVSQLLLHPSEDGEVYSIGSVIAELGDDAYEMVLHKDFLRATPAVQRSLLQSVCEVMDTKVSKYVDVEGLAEKPTVTVRLQGDYREMATWFESGLLKVSATGKKHDLESHKLSGKYSGFTYVELFDTPADKRLSREDFAIGHGAPSLVVVGDTAVYYIPAQQVVHVERSVDPSEADDWHNGNDVV